MKNNQVIMTGEPSVKVTGWIFAKSSLQLNLILTTFEDVKF